MELYEKNLRMQALELALQDLDRIIESMRSKNYSQEQINEYTKKRWAVWNEMHQVKKL